MRYQGSGFRARLRTEHYSGSGKLQVEPSHVMLHCNREREWLPSTTYNHKGNIILGGKGQYWKEEVNGGVVLNLLSKKGIELQVDYTMRLKQSFASHRPQLERVQHS